MKNLKKHRAKPQNIRQLAPLELKKVSGAGLGEGDVPEWQSWWGVWEPVNQKHLTEWQTQQEC